MSDEVLNPVAIEQAIQDISRRIHKAVPVVSNAETLARQKVHAFDLAYARAYMAHEGPAHEKKYAAVLATEAERVEADTAEVAFKYSERAARALESELRAQQSIGASVRSMYAGERGLGG